MCFYKREDWYFGDAAITAYVLYHGLLIAFYQWLTYIAGGYINSWIDLGHNQ